MRDLTEKELALVSGGFGFDGSDEPEEEIPEIVVVGRRRNPWVTTLYSRLGLNLALINYSEEMRAGGSPAPAQEPDKEDEGHDCEQSAATSIADEIRSRDATDGRSGTNQPEYGAVVAKKDGEDFVTGPISMGQSYAEADPPETSLKIPDGHSAKHITAIVHSHPSSDDVATDNRNKAPSDNDWKSADAIVAGRSGPEAGSEAGAEAENLTLYIIDKDGIMRAYEYMKPEARGATPDNPGGSADNESAGTVVDEDHDSSCSGEGSGS